MILSSIISLIFIQSFPKHRFRKQKFIKDLLLYQFPYIEKIFAKIANSFCIKDKINPQANEGHSRLHQDNEYLA
ncbi:hypothetical protein, partial [uncultured Prevotella sp.]|uniref:hypothetical protein n=1 Tax=uncultured Prevotella sp. TaxID=159272 RepID=UPI00261F901A